MEQKEIIEGNKLIAEFMGYEIYPKTEIVKIGKNVTTTIEQWAKYHSSWDWLMPVVEKIEQDNYGIKQCRKVVEIYLDDTKEIIIKVKEKSRIESLWLALVKFIRWYNQNYITNR